MSGDVNPSALLTRKLKTMTINPNTKNCETQTIILLDELELLMYLLPILNSYESSLLASVVVQKNVQLELIL